MRRAGDGEGNRPPRRRDREQRRPQESPAQRERRLARQKIYNHSRRKATDSRDAERGGVTVLESEEHRQIRLERQRAYNQRRRARGSHGSDPGDGDTARETDVHREQRLLRQREYDRRRMVPDQIEETPDDSARLEPVAPNVIKKIEEILQDALGAEGLDECVCAVCDRLVLRSSCERVESGESTCFRNMQRVLHAPASLPTMLAKAYCCEDMHTALAGLLLSRKGIMPIPKGVRLSVCKECFAALSLNTGTPPKFAIANGFFIGTLPHDLSQASWMERVMTQLVTVVAQTRIMRGGRHRAIRSHCMVFDSTPGPPATLLPRRIDRESTYRVVLAGPFTSEQTDRIRKLHEVRGQMVTRLLEFFESNNPFYAGVEIDSALIHDIQSGVPVCDNIFINHDEEASCVAMNQEQDSISSRTDVTLCEGEAERSVIERNILLATAEISPDASVFQRVVDLNSNEPTATPRLRLDHSSRFAGYSNVEAMMHPHLFPFGRGHPNEERQAFVSKHDCMKYYAMLSSRRFARDPTFMLTAFNRLSLEKMYTLTSVKCRRFSSLFDGYETISRDDLAVALVNNERRQRGEQRREHTNPTAERFLKSVELGSVSIWGSSAERRQCRQEAFGYQTRYGQPALFVTLTPNTDNSYAMAHYTGVLSVSSLFDVLEARMPTTAEMERAALMDDSASARLFMRNVDAFIEHVLAIDPKTMESRVTGGLFGRTKAYYGMVETQGRGTLHIHFLIWLWGAPVNSEDYEARMRQADDFGQQMQHYLDSIVTTSLPLRTEGARCSRCGVEGNFSPLRVPSRARRERSKQKQGSATEPALVECVACGNRCSSQHIIRNLLLRHRPPHWPPPLRPLTEEEREETIQKEVCARASLLTARNIVREREMTLAAMDPDDVDKFAEWMLQVNNPPQQSTLSAAEDPFRSDQMSRLIEMLPPTLDAARMNSMHRDFMLANLVVRLNMHAWSHTGSCFKASRSTTTAKLCRYGFPRDRAVETSVVGTSVILKRDLFHEYINGYNPTIMRAFKCNHDVQLLFGGKNAINRIYYTCKYVTKPQRQIDNPTAVALASFHRRESREAAGATSSLPPSIVDIRRRQVTGMIHTFTNKQEIAGPLAALYLFRGSCNYSSANCVRLPLSDVLKQLESSEDYSCTLVASRASQEDVYTSTSHLDDYIYRPTSATEWSLYEYNMRCYRRIASDSISDGHRFQDQHPLSASHCVAYRKREAVPVISGPRLPLLKDGMDQEQRQLFSKLALVLFKPFRKLIDLLAASADDDQPWYLAYSEWEPQRSQFTKNIMANMSDYHTGRESENEANVNEEVEDEDDRMSSGASNCGSSDDGYVSSDLDLSDGEFQDNVDTFFDAYPDADVDDTPLQMFPTPPAFSTSVESIPADFTQYQLVEGIARAVAEKHGNSMDAPVSELSAASLKKWVSNSATDVEVASTTDTPDVERINADRPTTINEIIDECLLPDELRWDPQPRHSALPQPVPLYAGVSAVSRSYTLNQRQHAAFAITAKHLLRRWRVNQSRQDGTTISDEEVQQRQLLMYLGGEGGTGKSRVVGAIQELCRCWERPASVVVTAMTGKAASLIGGRTLASFEMLLRSPTSHTTMRDVDCLIIDEVSMMSKPQLLRLDRLLRKSKRVGSVPFGGIHVIVVGDFLQLPPVGADPLFVNPASKAKVSLEDFEGFDLWHLFHTVVILRETVRFKDDPEWGEGCSRARYGEWTPAFMQMINARVIDHVREQAADAALLPENTIFVTPNNDTRSGINSHFIASTARLLHADEYPIRVVANFKGALNRLSNDDISYIMGLPDTSFGRMAPYLDLIRGMPIQITQNVRTKKGVANGTMGILHSVIFPPDTSFRLAFDRRTGTRVRLPDARPLYALVRVARGSNVVPIADGIDPELFPVFPDSEAYKKALIPLTPSSSDINRTLSVKIQQFPFVCAIGATIYKVQGETLRSMGVVDWKVGPAVANKPQQAYLMVSRVVKREGLICIKPITPAIAAWAKPPPDAIEEDRRLHVLSDTVLKDFYGP